MHTPRDCLDLPRPSLPIIFTAHVRLDVVETSSVHLWSVVQPVTVAAVAATVAAALLHLLLHCLHELLERDRILDTSSNPAPLPCEATFFLEPKHLPRANHRWYEQIRHLVKSMRRLTKRCEVHKWKWTESVLKSVGVSSQHVSNQNTKNPMFST